MFIWCTALVLLDVVGSGCGALRCRMRAMLASYNAAPRQQVRTAQDDAAVQSCAFSVTVFRLSLALHAIWIIVVCDFILVQAITWGMGWVRGWGYLLYTLTHFSIPQSSYLLAIN